VDIIAITSIGTKAALIAAVYRNGDGSNDRLSALQTGDVQEINTSAHGEESEGRDKHRNSSSVNSSAL